MKICVGSAGPFHAFDLARQMQRLGHLEHLYTAYPSWRVDGMPKEKVSTFPWLMAPAMLANRFGFNRVRDSLNVPMIETFDRWMAERIAPCDVFHCLSSFGLQSHRAAQSRHGALTVCDRGSAHIEYQDEILRDEFARFGARFAGIDSRLVERELEEYACCDLIFVPSSFAMRTFVAKGVPRGKLRLNPYGVDLAMFHREPKSDQTFRVLFVGTVSLQKGMPYLFEAMATLGRTDVELCVIGALEAEMRPLMAKYDGTFRYLGAVARGELYKHYSQASVLVLPSIQDGFGMVQAQAMACGVPVIATENTGAADLFNDGVEGFIVPIRDAAAIREKILALYENPPMREQMGEAAIARVRKLGGWDDYGVRAADYYMQALETRASEANANSLR
ncbi:glycosyltransferase family 4 protein [Candidatus Binatus sp.]|uniref:glycosyltransferase family 4 protein n=1 Tax=Candidatus Binatus sp. TaxID=2811406 RepID=UPI003C78DBDA